MTGDTPRVGWSPWVIAGEEGAPSPRDTPDAWLVRLPNGTPALEIIPAGEAGAETEQWPLVDGEAHLFSRTDTYQAAELELNPDWTWWLERPMPEAASTCWVTNGWQIDTTATSVQEMVEKLVEAGGEPGRYDVAFGTWYPPKPYRYEAAHHRFVPVEWEPWLRQVRDEERKAGIVAIDEAKLRTDFYQQAERPADVIRWALANG